MITTFEDVFGTGGPLIIRPARFEDNRGWFSESYNARRLADHGFTPRFVQDNLSFSKHKHTLRGLHYQTPPHAQGKLVSVVTGSILDIAVDIRTGLTSYGQSLKFELSSENRHQLWIPPGFLHGFLTLNDNTKVSYKVTDYYSADHDGAVAWNDPDLKIDWPVLNPVLSEKDAKAPYLRDIAPIFPQGWDKE